MSVDDLIRSITPMYNAYQMGQGVKQPAELLMVMWGIGDEIHKYIELNHVPPHRLYRDIYGKSEGATNVKQRSYIAREFLGRCYRIRRMFAARAEINTQLSGLTAMNHFREAMPFFDNPKYALNQESRKDLLDVINGLQSNQEKERYIRELQAKKIGIKNPRTQHLQRLDNDKQVFVKLYNDVFQALKLGDYEQAQRALHMPTPKFVEMLSTNSGAISADGLRMEEFEIPTDISPKWTAFATVIQKLIADENPKERRRFRRLIPPEKMLRLSEMLYALTSADKYNHFRV